MIVEIKQVNCKRLGDISTLSRNYHHLPFTVNDCNILCEIHNGLLGMPDYTIGDMNSGVYVARFEFGEEYDNDYFVINSDTLKEIK